MSIDAQTLQMYGLHLTITSEILGILIPFSFYFYVNFNALSLNLNSNTKGVLVLGRRSI